MDKALDSEKECTRRMTVRLGVIRDGTPGISLYLGDRRIGGWTDSRARSLSLTDNHEVRVNGTNNEVLYLFSAPGRVVNGVVVSDREVTLTFEL